MKVAVTGGSGFIGAHVLRELVSRGVDVTATVRSGEHLIPAEISIVPLDISTAGAGAFERLGRPDTLIHLAWQGLPNYTEQFHIEDELPRQRRFLEDCVRGGLRHVLVTGTCLEYGLQEGELTEDQPVDPRLPYSQAKLALCQHLLKLRQELGFGLTWLRVFYLYGPGQAPTSLYSLINAAIDRGDTRFPMSPGDQVRDFLPIGEAARCIAELACKQRNSGVVNLCSGQPATILELATRWVASRNSEISLETGKFDYPAYEPFAFWGSRRKLDQALIQNPIPTKAAT